MEKKLFAVLSLADEEAEEKAFYFANNGWDALLLLEEWGTDEEHDRHIGRIRAIARRVDVPLYVSGGIRRAEDVKKYLYAGAEKAVLDMGDPVNEELLPEVSSRFGREKLAVWYRQETQGTGAAGEEIQEAGENRKSGRESLREAAKLASEAVWGAQGAEPAALPAILEDAGIPVLALADFASPEDCARALREEQVSGIAGGMLTDAACPVQELKQAWQEAGIPVSVLRPAFSFSQLKKNSDGMVPVIVQDDRTLEVLMLAYMDEEAYNHTLRTGRMTYHSRSRDELWVKGDTSGHYQYVRSLTLDCDLDTILARVIQVGAACHTGSYSCFFQECARKEGIKSRNPHQVFEDVYRVILDRKAHPKEGSYTNYLFDKGIDKILKKVGEEASEIIIAAKNPDPEEIKYEMADFLYHAMVLMAEKGVTWEDITEELAKR